MLHFDDNGFLKKLKKYLTVYCHKRRTTSDVTDRLFVSVKMRSNLFFRTQTVINPATSPLSLPLLHYHWTHYSWNYSKGNIHQSLEWRIFPQEQFKWKTSMWFTLQQWQFQRIPLWTGKRALFLDRINILFKPERKWTELLPYAQTSENFFDQRWLDILMKFSICQDLYSTSKKAI